jgi:dTDP-4-dehydrorhamnose reductase
MIHSDLIKKRILIVGSNGLLGRRLSQWFSRDNRCELLCTSIENFSTIENAEYQILDITNKSKVKEIVLNFFPDYVINTAAFTNVDQSEIEREKAWRTNVNGVENLALYSWTVDAHLIHMSSDYIFDGKNGPYTEIDKPCPINYYGRTKLASENSIKSSGVRHTIIRSNVLYGPTKYGRPDFVKWVINSLNQNKEILIVADQYNNPTFIDDIVTAVDKIIYYKKEGIFNIAGVDVLSRLDFARKIAEYFKLNLGLIKPITTFELNQLAARPLKSGLITLKAQTELNYRPKTITETFNIIKKELDLLQ